MCTKRDAILLLLAGLLVLCGEAGAQTEANKAVISGAWLQMLNTADQTIADEIFAPDFTCHAPHYPQASDLAGYRVEVVDAAAVVADFQVVLEDLLAEDDTVVGRFTATGKWPPAGIPYTNTWTIFFRFVDGKIAEEWWQYDPFGVQQQLGVIEPARPAPEDYEWSAASQITGAPGDPEDNKALAMRFVEDVWNAHSTELMEELFIPDVVTHNPPVEYMYRPGNLQTLTQAVSDYLNAFPDFHVTIDQIVAEGDEVVGRWTATGTHGGALAGIPATGRAATWSGITMYRFADGKIVEMWWSWDMLSMMMQLTTPTPEELLAIADAARVALNAHDLDTFLSYFTEDGVFESVAFGHAFTGAEQIKAVFQGEFQAFPDWHITAEGPLAGAAIVVGESVISGTHQDVWSGIPATGNAVQLPALEIADFEGDKVKKLTIYSDTMSELIQLGVMPAPEMPELVPSFPVPDPEPTGLSPLEANDELLARWNTHDMAEFAKLLHADVQAYDSGFGIPLSREEYIAGNELFVQGFPDMTGQFIRAIDLGDGWVAVEVVFTGTHNGPFAGIPATGRTVSVRAGSLRRFNADGLVTDFALYYDMLGVMQQLTAVAPVDPGSEGLVAYYPLEGDATDSSGNGLDGTVMGDPQATTGAIGGAMEFDGDGDMIEVAHDAALDITGPISLALWIRPDAEDPEGQGLETAPMCKALSTASPSWSWQVRYGWNSPQPYMAFTFNTAPRAWAYVGQNLEQGEWHHIACSADGETLTAYLNGQATESTPMGAITSSPTPVLIGSDGWGSDWIGGIDEVRIYNRALSPGEVLFLTGYMTDVTAPGDLVQGVPNDGDWPAAETPELAIDDNVETKYLHFKGDFDPDAGPTGFRVKPSVGPTVVTGVSFTTANDVPGRDPVAFALYGSNGSIDGPYTLIASRDIVDFAGAEEWPRFTKNATPIVLNNATAYTYYQVLITAIRGPVGGSVNSMQIAEVELFGMPLVPPPDVEANKVGTRRLFDEIWNRGDMDAAEQLVAPDLVRVDTGNRDVSGPVGLEGLKLLVAAYRAAFPDIQFTVDDMIAEDDMVVARWTTTGTHLGELMGIGPTGLSVTSTGISLFRWVDGKMETEWVAWDSLGLMQQLGAVAPARPSPEDYAWKPSSPLTGAAGDPEVNKTMIMRFVEEVWNEKNLDPIVELFHPESFGNNPPVSYMYAPYMADARDEAFTQSIADYLAAIPDMHVTVHDIVAEGDKAAVYWTVTGTHGGELAGIPATGNPVTFSGHTMYRFGDGQIVESWWAWDIMGLMQQITPTEVEE